MASHALHPQLQRRESRIGDFVCLGTLKLIYDDAAETLATSCPQLDVSCTIDDGDHVCLAVNSGQNQICIRQVHFVPYATVYREHGRCTEIKTPATARLVALVKTYFEIED